MPYSDYMLNKGFSVSFTLATSFWLFYWAQLQCRTSNKLSLCF